MQALTFIPKADLGHFADNFRPLDMPDTVARMIDSVVFSAMMSVFALRCYTQDRRLLLVG